MNILIAPDKFKDAASATDICQYLKKGILRSFPSANCILLPLADGGEGTLESLHTALGGEFIYREVQDPLFRPVNAGYLLLESGQTAVIEMARASGIELLKPEERNCLETTSFGTGQLIRDAIGRGAKEIILTVGGTATNDAGMGIAEALGFEFFDEKGLKLESVGKNLHAVSEIRSENAWEGLDKINFIIATDVTNPFYGEKGAAFVFARQKGADEKGIVSLDKGLWHFSQILSQKTGQNPQELPGSGAGGGVGGGLACLLNAGIISAADWIISVNQVVERMANIDFLITGEGKIDSQTWGGKLIAQLLSIAENADVPAILICGTLQDVEHIIDQHAVLLAMSVLNEPMTLESALINTPQLVENQGVLLGKFMQQMVR
ncbi:glycerate kinase [Pseudarcicella hirudinis]|uniref:Glycerate kinase n=1 Tax=Pseudarcicella hirudinis TaxID=1079859 RepID=A0A1I5RL43_9BACT|nr:glycerate kinase [Pseudarcicella hirudinis]SFP59120.1 glycerate kinase [Pseudarcicella hirudinis]